MRIFMLSVLFSVMLLAAEGIVVNSYYGTYDISKKESGKASYSLDNPKKERWSYSEKAKKPYKIGVLFPHMKDPYFLAVNYGIYKQAKRAGVSFRLLEAGGYPNLATQIQQFRRLLKEEVDGIILASISYDKLDDEISEAQKQGVAVVEVINDIRAEEIQAKSLVSFFDMGYKAGEYVLKDAANRNVSVAFLPGPKGSGWAPESFEGFKTALGGAKNIVIKKPLWGNTDERTQKSLIKRAFYFYITIDYLVGNAVMAQVAPDVLKTPKDTQVVSTYIIPKVYQHIKEGKVAAAPSDLTVDQGRIAVDMMVKLLDGKKAGVDFPFRAGPEIPIITADTQKTYPYEMLFGDQSFQPVFENALD